MWQPSRHGEQVQRPALGSDAHVVLLLQQHRLLQLRTVHKNVQLTFAQSCLASAGAHHVSYFSKISTQVMIGSSFSIAKEKKRSKSSVYNMSSTKRDNLILESTNSKPISNALLEFFETKICILWKYHFRKLNHYDLSL